MSHFTIGVVIDPSKAGLPDAIHAWLDQVLEPFSERREVDPYPRSCWCMNREAKRYGETMADKLVGTWEERRELFTVHLETTNPDLAQVRQETWGNPEVKVEWQQFNQAFNQEWDETADAYAQNHPHYLKPDPDCESCDGTGYYESTYNPQSKWDWWRIGGRWDGSLFGIDDDVATDKGFNWGDEHETLERNQRPVDDFLNGDRKALYIPFALITPDGEWHEKVTMGWWGLTRNDKDPLDWGDQVQRIYEQYPDHHLVLLDAHI